MSEKSLADWTKSMSRRVGLTLLCATACGAHAFYFVESAISAPTAQPGYESDWHFLLLLFCIFRLPIWIAGFILLTFSAMLTSIEDS